MTALTLPRLAAPRLLVAHRTAAAFELPLLFVPAASDRTAFGLLLQLCEVDLTGQARLRCGRAITAGGLQQCSGHEELHATSSAVGRCGVDSDEGGFFGGIVFIAAIFFAAAVGSAAWDCVPDVRPPVLRPRGGADVALE